MPYPHVCMNESMEEVGSKSSSKSLKDLPLKSSFHYNPTN